MTAPAISHVICSMGLVALIFVLPFFYSNVAHNIESDVIARELQEITDYTSNTIENLYFLVNSTTNLNINLEKELLYLPSLVEGSIYTLSITEVNGTVTAVGAYLQNDPSVNAVSWVSPGLKLDEKNLDVRSSDAIVIVGCTRDQTGVYVWISYA